MREHRICKWHLKSFVFLSAQGENKINEKANGMTGAAGQIYCLKRRLKGANWIRRLITEH